MIFGRRAAASGISHAGGRGGGEIGHDVGRRRSATDPSQSAGSPSMSAILHRRSRRSELDVRPPGSRRERLPSEDDEERIAAFSPEAPACCPRRIAPRGTRRSRSAEVGGRAGERGEEGISASIGTASRPMGRGRARRVHCRRATPSTISLASAVRSAISPSLWVASLERAYSLLIR